MDPIHSYLGKLLLEEITPVVMVLSTPLAEQACQKNGLSFREMLLPFSLFSKIDVPVRTASDQPYRLQMFKLRLVYASDVHEQNYETAEEHLKQVVTEAGQSIYDLPSEPPQLEAVLNLSESDSRPSWILNFNKELIRTLSFSEHEAFDHPVACLLVVSSQDERPINRFVDLFNTDQLPSLLNEGLMDPKILKHFLLLHDYQYGPIEKATNVLAEMRTTFGSSHCRLLCINSAQDVACEKRTNLWVPYKVHGQDIACFLDDTDLNEIKDFMQDLSSKHIIPYMEQKIRILNEQVSATRKGFRNQIKNLWWRKGKEDAPDTLPMYTFSSIESQMRLLGDYAFMLRDYELALSNYRLLSTDYKLDKAWKRYAGVQEMMGLSYFLLNQSRKDSEYCMENAFNTYVRIRPNGRRYATRCGLWWAEMLRAWGQYKDAASLYFRISSEEPHLHAAVMFEQASYCYLFSDPPLLRKYGFHLVLAGNRYNISDQRQHAIRTYKNALFVYKGNTWTYISDHVHFNMGRWYAFLGMFDVAIKHMLEILACSHQSLVTQDLFLGDFFDIVKNMGKAFEVDKLQLPAIDMSSLKVIHEDHRTYASSTDISASESLWHSLEEEFSPSMSTSKPNWLDSQSKFSPLQKSNDYHFCVVGEAIKVYLEFKNPLQISISVSGLSLICELSVGSEAAKLDRSASAAGPHDETEEREASSCREVYGDANSFQLSDHDFVLEGNEIKLVQLHVTPKLEGMLKIVGVKWTLSGSILGYHYFNFGTKKKDKKGKRQPRYSATSKLDFVVIKGLPKLEGYIHDIPKKTYIGDLRLLKLELRNPSDSSVKNVKMKISHPRFLMPGSLEELNVDFPSWLQKQMNSESKYVPASSKDNSKSLLFLFPSDAGIEGGTTLVWPLWFHAGLTGKISLYISIYYEVENCSSDMSYRTLRMHYDLEVLPSLDVSLLITPSSTSLQEFLVRMDIMNRTSSQNFCLHQLSSFCDRWQILSLPECASICSLQMLLAGQAMSCFFKLKDCIKDSQDESKVAVRGSDVLLGSQGANELPINVSRSPLASFRQQERLHQEKSAQEYSSTFDFVLLSKTHGSSNEMEAGEVPKLLAHYASHCSVSGKSPIWWLMDGPRTINHDFSASFCEASIHVMIQNCSDTALSVKVITFDTLPDPKRGSTLQFSDSSGNNQGGWHDISLVNDIKAISNVQVSQPRKPPSESISPVVWCASSSTQLKLEPGSTAAAPLRICIFAPGTYDLSSYELQWKLLLADEDGRANDVRRRTSGSSRGHPFYLTVLQTP